MTCTEFTFHMLGFTLRYTNDMHRFTYSHPQNYFSLAQNYFSLAQNYFSLAQNYLNDMHTFTFRTISLVILNEYKCK